MESDSLPFGELIKRLSTIYEKRANCDMKARDVTFTQMMMLTALDEAPEKTRTLKSVEHQFGVAQSTAAGIVARLEKKGLIRALADPADRRIKILQLTEAGQALCAGSRADLEAFDRRMLACLEPAERDQLLQLMTRVCRDVQDRTPEQAV